MQNSLAREKSKQKDTVLEKQETLMTVNKKPEKIFLDNPKDFFHLTSGETIASIQELRSVLDNIDNDTFHHYVNSHKNDFASWIEHIFKKQELANKIRDITSKEELKQTLKNEGY